MKRKHPLRLLINLFSLLYLLAHLTWAKDTFSQISPSVFTNINCVPYAYGDFNADKRVDIFCVSNFGLQVEIWLAQEREPLFEKANVFSLK
jgi:hypothetical protein